MKTAMPKSDTDTDTDTERLVRAGLLRARIRQLLLTPHCIPSRV
jgi:hypothetical protein